MRCLRKSSFKRSSKRSFIFFQNSAKVFPNPADINYNKNKMQHFSRKGCILQIQPAGMLRIGQGGYYVKTYSEYRIIFVD